MILTPQQAFAILTQLEEPERTRTLLDAAIGLRISERLGLQWHEVSFERSQIHVRRTFFSLGGMVAQEIAVARPSLGRKMLLVPILGHRKGW